MENEKHFDIGSHKINGKVHMMNMGGNPPFGRGPRRDEELPMGPPPGAAPEGPPPFGGRGEQQPRSAPPNFIPEAPRMERGPEEQRRGQERQTPPFIEFGTPFGQGPEQSDRDENRRRRELRRCVNRFTFFWLFNGDSFWFYPTFVDDRFVRGFRWRRDRWVFDRIYIRRIFFFRCY